MLSEASPQNVYDLLVGFQAQRGALEQAQRLLAHHLAEVGLKLDEPDADLYIALTTAVGEDLAGRSLDDVLVDHPEWKNLPLREAVGLMDATRLVDRVGQILAPVGLLVARNLEIKEGVRSG